MDTEKYKLEALRRYDLPVSDCTFLRHNENLVYILTDSGEKRYVLRIHKTADTWNPGLFAGLMHTPPLLAGEMQILLHLAACGMHVQTPVTNRYGQHVTVLDDGTPVTLLTWLDGKNLEESALTPAVLQKTGAMLATMHRAFAQFPAAHAIVRYRYGQSLTMQIDEKLVLIHRAGVISDSQLRTMRTATAMIRMCMDTLERAGEPLMLTHCDVAKSNLILSSDGETVSPIDFCLSGWSWRYMDLAPLLDPLRETGNREAVLSSYEVVWGKPLDRRHLPPFLALGVLLYVATRWESASQEDWFAAALARWCSDIFAPLDKNAAY